MSHLTNPRIGYAGQATRDTTGRAPIEAISGDPSGVAPGVPFQAVRTVTFVPATLQANNIVASAIINGAAILAAGTGVTATTFKGVSVLDITGIDGCARNVRIVGASSVTSVTFTIVGFDQYGIAVTENVTGPTGATTTSSTKTFRYISSITSSGTTTAAVTIGTGDVYGLPARADNFGSVLISWADALITASTGFVAAVTTSPATAVTGDVRGTYATQSASNGTRRLRMTVFLDNPNTMTAAYGVAQYSA